MTPKSDHLFTHVAAVGEESYLLGQPGGINFNKWSVAAQQFSDAFLQARAIGVHQPRRRVLNDWNQRIDSLDAVGHLQTKCLAFLRAHAFEFIRSLSHGAFDTRDYIIAKAIARRL